MAARTRRPSSSATTKASAPHTDPVTHYASEAVAGRIVAGPLVRAACARHLRDLKEGGKRGLVWDLDAVHRVFRFFRDVLRLNGGEFEGQPFELEPWQKFIVGSLFGWKRKNGFRRFKTAYIEIGKGNGKSPLAAGIGLYMMLSDINPKTGKPESRSEVYAAASKRDQAMVLFRDAVAMVDQSPELDRRIKRSGSKGKEWNLAHIASGSFFRPISADDGQSGPRPHCGLADEVHEHRNRTVVQMLKAGARKRGNQALIVEITNSGFNRNSICWEHHEYSEKVVTGGKADDTWFAFVCGLDKEDIEGDAYLDRPECWAKANPNLGVSVQIDGLKEAVDQARSMPAERATIARLNFCIWTDAFAPWIEAEKWRAAQREVLDLDVLKGRPCWLGLDLSQKRDLTALAAVWVMEDGSLAARVWFWTPKDTLRKRADTDNVPYEAWEAEKHIEAPLGSIIDKAYVARVVQTLCTEHDVRGLAYDQAQIEDFLKAADDIGLDAWIYEDPEQPAGEGLMMVRHGQGFLGWNSKSTLWMPRSVEALETAIINGKLGIQTNPCLTWNSASAVLEQNEAGSKKWNKRKATGRIDGMVALTEAVGLAMHPPEIAGRQKTVVKYARGQMFR